MRRAAGGRPEVTGSHTGSKVSLQVTIAPHRHGRPDTFSLFGRRCLAHVGIVWILPPRPVFVALFL